MAKRRLDIESELPQAKRVRFEEETPRRSEGRARRKLQLVAFRKYLPATFYAPGEGFSHETRYQAEHDRAEVCKSENRQGTSECQDAPEGLHANKTAPRKLMTYLIYFQMRKYATNLYLHGTEVTRSFAAFGGSYAPGKEYCAVDFDLIGSQSF